MALIMCSECGKEFSDKAIACPGCGYPSINNTIHAAEGHSNKICFILGIISFLLGAFFIFANLHWFLYGFAFIILAVLDLIFYKNHTYLIIAGMLYLVLALFSLITIPSPSGKYFVLIIFATYSAVFLTNGFKYKDKPERI